MNFIFIFKIEGHCFTHRRGGNLEIPKSTRERKKRFLRSEEKGKKLVNFYSSSYKLVVLFPLVTFSKLELGKRGKNTSSYVYLFKKFNFSPQKKRKEKKKLAL